MMPNGDPREGFFYPNLTFMMDSYIVLPFRVHKGVNFRAVDLSAPSEMSFYIEIAKSS